MKRIAQLLGLTALSLAFIGCSPSAEKPADNNDGSGSTGANEKGVIAYSPLTLSNPFFKVIGDNIKSEAEKHGYETLMVDPDMDVKKQSDQMEDYISRGVTAIILVPCDRLSIGPSVKAANEKGIPADDPYAKHGPAPVWAEYEQILDEAKLDLKLEPIQKWDFYDAVMSDDHVLTIQTADQALWANVLLTIGCRLP